MRISLTNKQLTQAGGPRDPGAAMGARFRVLRMASFALLGAALLAVVGVGFFVYSHVYAVIGQTESILSLEFSTRTGVIDINLLEQVENAWNAKHTVPEPSVGRDPFSPVPPPPAEPAP